MTDPILLTESEVRDRGVDPSEMTPAGTYYDPKHKKLGRMVGSPLFRSRDVRSRLAPLVSASSTGRGAR